MILSYARVSTAEQAADNATSLDEQKRRNRAWAVLKGHDQFDITEYVDAGVSGADPLGDRPAGARLLEEARAGDVLVAVKLDRLFRSASDALVTVEQLRERKVEVVLLDIGVDSLTGNGTAKLFFGILASIAEFERERIAERMDDGRKAKVSKGGYAGGGEPYGYRTQGEGRDAILVSVPEEQRIIELILELHATRPDTYAFIQRELNERGIVTRTGKPWHINQIQRVINRERPKREKSNVGPTSSQADPLARL